MPVESINELRSKEHVSPFNRRYRLYFDARAGSVSRPGFGPLIVASAANKLPRYVLFAYRGGCSYVADRVGRGVSDVYETAEATDLATWLNDRAAGYPSLDRFKGAADAPD